MSFCLRITTTTRKYYNQKTSCGCQIENPIHTKFIIYKKDSVLQFIMTIDQD
jgi:hypothetical protein